MEYEKFKANIADQIAYREAYAALSVSDPAAALLMPHPDSTDHDVTASLATIRGYNVKLKADPRMEIKG